MFASFLFSLDLTNNGAMVNRFKHHDIIGSFTSLLIMGVISDSRWSARFFKSEVGSSYYPYDLFEDIVIIFLNPTLEVGPNISNIFPLNIIVQSMTILPVIYDEPEMIAFLVLAILVMKNLLNLLARSSVEVKCERLIF